MFAGGQPAFGQAEDVNAQKAKQKSAADQLYSMRLIANSTFNQEVCTPIPVPEGMRLVLETVAADVSLTTSLPDVPEAHIRLSFVEGGSVSFDRLLIPLMPLGTAFSGHLRTRIISGPLTVGDDVVSLALCGRRARVEGYIVGHLLPL